MTPDPRNEKLLQLVGDIADGRPVDWEEVEARDPGVAECLGALRVLEGVVAAHAAVPDAPSLAPGSMWGPLTIVSRIGGGRYGEVYRAFEPSLQREVALKLLHSSRCASPEETRRFLAEARRLARVRHNHVLTVHGAEVYEGRAGMWTDLIRGRTLEEIVLQEGPFGAHEAALVGIDLSRALAALHAADLIHRDVKTHNVMREEGGRIVLMDFGSVGELASGEPDPGEETVRGTPLAAAPELLRYEPATKASDLYSLGVLLYRLTTASYPYEGGDVLELVRKQEHGEARPLREARPDLPVDFVQAVERATEIDPARRFPGCAAMERALVACLGSESIGAARGVSAESDARRGRRSWMKAAATWGAAAAVVALAIAIPGMMRQEDRSGDTKSLPSPVTSREGRSVSVPEQTEPAPTIQPSLTATATLFRQSDGSPEPLPQNARITPGDALFLELEGPEPMNVYVLNEDEAGRLYVLFPLPGFDISNPLPGGARHRLPGTRAGGIENWEVTSAGGSEDLLVIASRQPIAGLEKELAQAPRAAPDQPLEYREVSSETAVRLRGIGGTRPDASPGPAARRGRLSEILSGISRSPQSRLRDIWMWQTRLYNPAPDP